MSKIQCLILAFVGLGTASPCFGAEKSGEDPWSRAFPNVGEKSALVVPGLISTGDDESHPTLSPDGHTLFFLKNTPSFDFWTIVYSELSTSGWSRPQTAPFSGQYPDGDLVFAAGGKRAFFVSSRPVDGIARTDTEIWTLERTASGWSDPRHVAELSSPSDEYFPTLTADQTIYFGSGRPGGLGGHDIWRSRLVGGVYQKAENLGAPVNSDGEEIEAFVTPAEDALIIAAKNRGDEIGSYDLYRSRRGADGWTTPRNLGAAINSTAWEFSPRLSPDGALFSSQVIKVSALCH